jgi:4-amino-4-deoxy-L-arabinose transferase-like glycosyltransferase
VTYLVQQNQISRSVNRFAATSVIVVMIGFALRLFYVLVAKVDAPIYGDGLHYVSYAWNLVNHGVYSSSSATASIAIPDSYRAPAFPMLLATSLWLANDDLTRAIFLTQVAQCFFGAATIAIAIALAREWIGQTVALVIGFLLAFWPHLITFAGTLMSETLFGFFIVLGLWLLCVGERLSRSSILAGAGAAFGGAYFVNAIILAYPFLAAALLWRRGKGRLAGVFLVVTLIAPAAWSVRNLYVESPEPLPGVVLHAIDGFVWGSSPMYMPAFNSRWVSADAAKICEIRDEETRRLVNDPVAGVKAIFERIASDPLPYFKWYFVEKPFLLWDWPIVIGTGDIYYPVTRDSPFERITMLHAIKQTLRFANPAIFVFALGISVLFVWRLLVRPRNTAFAAMILALFFAYVTSIHALLQAEPRYGIAYRSEEIILAVAAASMLYDAVRRRLHVAKAPLMATDNPIVP